MEYSCNVPILLIFFNRPNWLKLVFEKVREVKPSNLILVQDGARNLDDLKGIEECREIVSHIDWECEVVREYSDVNLGCGERPKSAIDFALKLFDKVIILEDDCVPTISFFRYCEELLERYQEDDRIAYISGLNHFESWDCGDYDYFFSRAASIGAWATWRRSWCRFYDYYAKNINDSYILKLYKQQVDNNSIFEQRREHLIKAEKSLEDGGKLSYWDTQWGFAEFTQNMLAIVPKVNQICNVGAGEESTHAQKSNKKFVKYKNILFMPTYELEFPLKHPNFCACDMDYHRLVYKVFQGGIIKRNIKRIKRFILRKMKSFK